MWGEKRFEFGERLVGRQKGRVVVKEGRKESGLQSYRTVVCSVVLCRLSPVVRRLSVGCPFRSSSVNEAPRTLGSDPISNLMSI